MTDSNVYPPLTLNTPFPSPLARLALCAPVDPLIGAVVVAASDVDRAGHRVVEDTGGAGAAVLRPDAKASGRAWLLRVILGALFPGFLFASALGLLVIVMVSTEALYGIPIDAKAGLLFFALLVGAAIGSLIGTRLWSGQTMRVGSNLVLGELGAQLTRSDNGRATTRAVRYDGDEAWLHVAQTLVQSGDVVGGLEAIEVFDLAGKRVAPPVFADRWMISAVLPRALAARARARVPVVRERLQRGEAVRFLVMADVGATTLTVHPDRVEHAGKTLPLSGIVAQIAAGSVMIAHGHAGSISLPYRSVGDAMVLLEVLTGRPVI